MKRLSIAVLVLAAACSQPAPPPPAPAPPPPPDPAAVRSTIEANNTAFVNAMLKGDAAAAVGASYADDAVVMMSNMPKMTGKDAIQGLFTGLLAEMTPKAMSFHTDEVMVTGDLAIETGAYQMTLQPKKGPEMKDEGKYLTVWKKQPDGRWRIIRDISNTNQPAAAPGK
jgi:uncharacterized protein (TIGR02246 family)